MRPIEQLLLTFFTDRPENRIEPVRKTNGVLAIELDEALRWGESFRPNLNERFEPMNLFFHPLPSGRFALGRLLPSRRVNAEPLRGDRNNSRKHASDTPPFLIHYLIVGAEELYRFGNNPVALHLATIARPEIAATLFRQAPPEPIALDTDGSFFDPDAIRSVCAQPGIDATVALTASVVAAASTLFTGAVAPLHLICAVLNLLPIDYRPEVSFASDLEFSPDRCLRLNGFSPSRENPPKIQYQSRTEYLNLRKTVAPNVPLGGWARFVQAAMKNDLLDFFERRLLAEHLAVRRKTACGEGWFPPSAAELDRIGNVYADELARFLTLRPKEPTGMKGPDLADPEVFRVRKRERPAEKPLTISEKLRRWLLEEHPDESLLCERETVKRPALTNEKPTPPLLETEAGRMDGRDRIPFEEPLLVYEGQNRLFSPFQRLLAIRPEWEKELLELDSLIAHTLSGETSVTENLARCWRRLIERGDQEFINAAQEEYIHLIQAILIGGKKESDQSPKHSLSALDILDLFLNETFQ